MPPNRRRPHTTGRVTKEDIDYARQDVKCTTALLNAMKREFDRHPIDLLPEKAYSPATIAKGYLEAMGIIPPLQKFDIPEKIQGIAMQSYYGGRAECRVRCTEVPVVPVDFVSQYATVCSLLATQIFLLLSDCRSKTQRMKFVSWLTASRLTELSMLTNGEG